MTLATQMKPISAEKVAEIVSSSFESSGLIVDCRSLLAFNADHIETSVNANVPSILARRRGGIMPTQSLLSNSEARQKLASGQCKFIVIYDDNGQLGDTFNSFSDNIMPPQSQLSSAEIIFRSFSAALSTNTDICYLKGGFDHFRCAHPHLCSARIQPSDAAEQDEEEGGVQFAAGAAATCRHLSVSSASPDAGGSDEQLQLQQSDAESSAGSVGMATAGGPVEVLPWLFIGSAQHVAMTSRLRDLDITAVLNVSSRATSPANRAPDVHYEHLPVDDGWSSDLRAWLPQAIRFLDGVYEDGGRALVHCQAGVSRSATVVIGYLMMRRHMGLDDAFEHVRHCRRQVAPNLSFLGQLQALEDEGWGQGQGQEGLESSLQPAAVSTPVSRSNGGLHRRPHPTRLTIPGPAGSATSAPCSAGVAAATGGAGGCVFNFGCRSPVVLSPS